MLKVGMIGGASKDPQYYKNLRDFGFEAIDLGFPQIAVKNSRPKEGANESYLLPLEDFVELYRPAAELAREHGIIYSQCHASYPLTSFIYHGEETEEFSDFYYMHLEKIAAVCQMNGCPNIVVHPDCRPTKEAEIEANLKSYRRLIPIAQKYGVKLCLENMFDRFHGRPIEGSCVDADEVCYYIDTLNAEAGGDYFGFCMDTGHLALAGVNIRKFINTLGNDRLACLHIHDVDGREDFHMMPYTNFRRPLDTWAMQSCVDWEGFIEGMRDIGYDKVLSFETGGVSCPGDVSLIHPMRRYMASIGHYFAKRIEAPKS
jgi:sugar phosphate isomerase/epimerase